jgi:glycolate oxidase iron-sulfur subunit
LLDIGRKAVDEQVVKPRPDRLLRWAIRAVLPYPGRFGPLWRLGRTLRPILPPSLRRKLLPFPGLGVAWPAPRQARTMLVLNGCVQAAVAPGINAAAALLLDRLGISLVAVSAAGCCGALSHHLSANEEARAFMRRNIDAWWPMVERGAEAIVLTASGCGVFVKDYGYLLRDDPAYAAKAKRISAMASGLAEVLVKEDLSGLVARRGGRIACHSPCTLQHGQKLPGLLEDLLRSLEFDLVPVEGAQLCCGSAGSYSLMHPDLSHQLLSAKIQGLEVADPDLIVTDNIGCLMHLQSGTERPVRHWAEVLAERLSDAEGVSEPGVSEY